MQQVNPAAQSVLVPQLAPAGFFAIAVAVAVALGVTDAVAVALSITVAVVATDALGSGDATSGVLDALGVIVTVAVDDP